MHGHRVRRARARRSVRAALLLQPAVSGARGALSGGPRAPMIPPPSGRFGFCGILYVRIIDVPYFGLRARTGWARCCSPTRPPKDGRRKQAVGKLDAFRSVQDAWAGRDGVPVSGVAGRGRSVAYVAGDRSCRWAICCRDRCAERAARVCCDVEKCRIIMYHCCESRRFLALTLVSSRE